MWGCSTLTNLLLPNVCVMCGEAAKTLNLCASCERSLTRIAAGCLTCAVPLSHSGECAECRRAAPLFHHIVAPFHYRPPLSALIWEMKFRRRIAIARTLGFTLAKALTAAEGLGGVPQLLLPVPLHRSRLRDRGFNQALEITRVLAEQLRVPFKEGALARGKATETQTRLNRQARRKNVAGAFHLRKPLNVGHVAIIDDVVTTGSTISEVARVLRHAGIGRVDVWACARAQYPSQR